MWEDISSPLTNTIKEQEKDSFCKEEKLEFPEHGLLLLELVCCYWSTSSWELE